MKLTEQKCKNTKPLKMKTIKMSDGRGLHLQVKPSGSKYWRYSYRFAGHQHTLALGVYPRVSLKQARNKLDEARKLLDDGKDPYIEMVKEKASIEEYNSNTFEKVARRWHEIQKSRISERYSNQILTRLEDDIFPYIGKLPIGSIKPTMMLKVLRRVEDRGAIETAHRMKAKCSEIFCFAIVEQIIDYDPTSALKKALKTYQSGNFASIDASELGGLIKAIKYNDTRMYPTTRNLIILMMLTFVRTSELIKAEWSWVNFDDKTLIIPAQNMKVKRGDHIVPLSDQAISYLYDQQGSSSNRQHIFPSPNKPRQAISNNAILSALYGMGYKGKMTGHGFRALATTIIIEKLKYDPSIPDRQLGHLMKDKSVRAYNRAQYLEQRTKMMQDWGDYIENIYKDV
jgi:integrase